jgi:hypothetical protein
MKLYKEDNETIPAFIVQNDVDPAPAGFTHTTALADWETAFYLLNDYAVLWEELNADVKSQGGFNSLSTNADKQLAIDHFTHVDNLGVYDDTNAVAFLMGNGMSQPEAQSYILDRWQLKHEAFNKAYSQRIPYIKKTVLMYLSTGDALDLLKIVKNLMTYYKEDGLVGTNYGDEEAGVMDYVESTDAYFNNGLTEDITNQGYTLLQGTAAAFVADLKDIIVHGIYTKLS